MKRLALFLLGAFVLFEASYALRDTRMFFGTSEPAPVSGKSERPAVEAALQRLDAALVDFYATGDDAPARAVLADPDGPASPLHEWRSDRHVWLQEGGQVPALALRSRRVVGVSVAGLDSVSAVTNEVWDVALDGGFVPGGFVPRAGLIVRYRFRRSPGGLLVDSVVVEP